MAPAWLVQQVTEEWFDRYSHRFEQYRLPKGQEARHALAESVGAGWYALAAGRLCARRPGGIAATEGGTGAAPGVAAAVLPGGRADPLALAGNLPPADELIQSPYDPEAHYSQKRTRNGSATRPITETCDEDAPHLIVNVETTVAPAPDSTMTDTIHAHLAQATCLPGEHPVDAGYVDAGNLATLSRTTPWLSWARSQWIPAGRPSSPAGSTSPASRSIGRRIR